MENGKLMGFECFAIWVVLWVVALAFLLRP
jgi:hypothetical protein